jgi:hypothetical protein
MYWELIWNSQPKIECFKVMCVSILNSTFFFLRFFLYHPILSDFHLALLIKNVKKMYISASHVTSSLNWLSLSPTEVCSGALDSLERTGLGLPKYVWSTPSKSPQVQTRIMIFVKYKPMRFDVLTAVKMSMLVFWVVTPCGLVGRYQRFGGTYCLYLQDWSEDGGRTFLRNVGIYPQTHMTSQPRRTINYNSEENVKVG